MRAQGGFNRRAHLASPILVHAGVGQRCRAGDDESPAKLPTMSTRDIPAGRWMRAQGGFNRRAHPASPILVHVGVGQRGRAREGPYLVDVESPAILPKHEHTRDVPAGRWMLSAQGGSPITVPFCSLAGAGSTRKPALFFCFHGIKLRSTKRSANVINFIIMFP